MSRISADLKISGDPVAPGWIIKNCGAEMSPGYHKELNGRKDVLVTHPLDRSTGCTLSKEVEIPQNKKTRLLLSVGHHASGDWTLLVKMNGQMILQKEVDQQNAPEGWMDVQADLSEFAGQKGLLEMVNQPSGWAWEAAYWDTIEIQTD